MTEPIECPNCGGVPEVREFRVNPMFGGGVAYEAECPDCGLREGVQYRTEDAAIEGWNMMVRLEGVVW